MKASGITDKTIYSKAVEIAKSLLTRVVFFPIITEDGRKAFDGFQWISYIRYVEGKGYFIARINEDMKPYLLNLKEKFTKYNLDYALKMRSFYSIRIYELLSQFKNTGWRQIEIEELRNLLGIGQKHSRYNDLKRTIIEHSKKEINKLTDLNIEYEEIKTGRKVTSIKFIINIKSEFKLKEKYQDINNMKRISYQTIHDVIPTHEKAETTSIKINSFIKSKIIVEQERKILNTKYSEILKYKREELEKEATEILNRKYQFFSKEQIMYKVLELYEKLPKVDENQETFFDL